MKNHSMIVDFSLLVTAGDRCSQRACKDLAISVERQQHVVDEVGDDVVRLRL